MIIPTRTVAFTFGEERAVKWEVWLCAGQARLFAGALRERTNFLHGVKPSGKLVQIKEASPVPVRRRRRVAEGNCIPVRGAERKLDAKSRADRTEYARQEAGRRI